MQQVIHTGGGPRRDRLIVAMLMFTICVCGFVVLALGMAHFDLRDNELGLKRLEILRNCPNGKPATRPAEETQKATPRSTRRAEV